MNHLTVLIHSESVRDTVLSVGTVMGHLGSVDPVIPDVQRRVVECTFNDIPDINIHKDQRTKGTSAVS